MHTQSALYGFLTVDPRPLAVCRGVYTAFHAITAARVKLIRRRNRADQSVRAADMRLPHRARSSYEKQVRWTSMDELCLSHRLASGRRRPQSSTNNQQICIQKTCHRDRRRRHGKERPSFRSRGSKLTKRKLSISWPCLKKPTPKFPTCWAASLLSAIQFMVVNREQ